MSGIKTFSNETSERYALALFELSQETNEVDRSIKGASKLLDIFKTNHEFQVFIKNPTYQEKVQRNILTDICTKIEINKNLFNFVMFLIVKRRIFFLNQILEKFLKISSRKSGKIEAELTSSKKLSESELSVINTEISKTIGSKVNLSYQVDKSLISGIKLQVGSFLIDSSISNKLKKYKQIMVDK